VKESWLAKLGNWSEALDLYTRRKKEDPHDVGALLGIMKCLDALGQWDEIMALCRHSWSVIGSEDCDAMTRKKVINLAAHATWKLKKWDAMESYANHLGE